MRRLMCLLIAVPLAAPLGGCGFEKYDGRWVADIGPTANCCPARIYMDVDGHKITGQSEDCHGIVLVGGKIDEHGVAHVNAGGAKGTIDFNAENFDSVLPGDVCKRRMVGNRGG
jgi:hypothetical protein